MKHQQLTRDKLSSALSSPKVAQAVLVLYATAALVIVFALKSQFSWPDEEDYYNLAHNLVRHFMYSTDGSTLTAFRPPGYSFFLASLAWITPSIKFLRVATFALWLCCAYLVFWISKTLFGKMAGVIAALICPLYLVSLFTSLFLYPQTLAATLFLCSVCVHLKFKDCRPIWCALEGLLFGALILTVPMYLFALPALIAFHSLNPRVDYRKVLAVSIFALLPVGCWAARNYVALHAFVLVGTGAGSNLLIGNSPLTTANVGVTVDLHEYWNEAQRHKMNEVQRDRFFRQAAIDWAIQNPRKWLSLYLRKVLNWFNFRNDLATTAESSKVKWVVLFFTWYSLLGLALVRLFLKNLKFSRTELYLWTVYLSGVLSYALFFTRIRFRLPYDYILIIEAAGCVDAYLRPRQILQGAATLKSAHVLEMPRVEAQV